MTNRTVHLHRVLRARPDKVYRAFLEAGAMAKWLPPYGFTCQVHHLEARIGGTFRPDNVEGFVRLLATTLEVRADPAGADRTILRRIP